jgi:hypothetical protein
MSYQIGIDTIRLRPTPRLAHTEYCSHDRLKALVQERTGQPLDVAWQFDFCWSTNDGPVPWQERGRTTDMGHAEYLEGGTDKRPAKPSPFQTVADVWAFDAVKEYGLPDRETIRRHAENQYREAQAKRTACVVPGGYYKTIVSGAIQAFGWDMLLAAAADRRRFERVLDSFFRLTLHHCQVQAETSIEVFISHDDMVWSQGPFMHPDFYRSVIFPRYRELWTPLRRAGKKVLFCSDGDWSMFVRDIVEAGADGLIFEPMVPLEPVAREYGKSHVIAASMVDCRTLTFGSPRDIQAEIDATLPLAFDCPGFIFAVGNHIPSNVPIENALFYYDYLSARWNRP